MRVLIADDDIPFVEFLTLMIEDAGHQVAGIVTTGGPDVMAAYDRCAPDAVLIDFVMPYYNGVIAARRILDKHPTACVVIISGLPDTDKLRKVAKEAGALAVLRKPFSLPELTDLLAAVRHTPRLLRATPDATPSRHPTF